MRMVPHAPHWVAAAAGLAAAALPSAARGARLPGIALPGRRDVAHGDDQRDAGVRGWARSRRTRCSRRRAAQEHGDGRGGCSPTDERQAPGPTARGGARTSPWPPRRGRLPGDAPESGHRANLLASAWRFTGVGRRCAAGLIFFTINLMAPEA